MIYQKSVLKRCLLKWASSWENRLFVYAKTKMQISFAVTAKLISVFVFATKIVQSLYFPNTKFQASSYLLLLYSLVCVRPGRKPRRPVFSQRGLNRVGSAEVWCFWYSVTHWLDPTVREKFIQRLIRLFTCPNTDSSRAVSVEDDEMEVYFILYFNWPSRHDHVKEQALLVFL